MILTDVQHYLAEHKQATVGDLALHFGIAPDAMRGMLDFLARKGKVYPLPLRPKCKGCTLCDTTFLESYEWFGDVTQPGFHASTRPFSSLT